MQPIATTGCPECGARGVASVEECQRVFAALGAREFADRRFFKAHRLTVDAYCLQHPEQYMVSSKSAATHLMAICWSLERGHSLHLPAPIKRWVDGPCNFSRVSPPAPRCRGAFTVDHVAETTDPAEYELRAGEWAESAWEAWREHWQQARRWLALAEGASSR